MTRDDTHQNRSGMDPKLSEVRRRDRAKEDDWIRGALAQAPYGFMATVRDGRPFLHSNLYVYDDSRHAIYIHTARVGLTRGNVEGDESVCFSVATMGRLLPADEALEFSVEFAGVTAFGRARVIEDVEEKTYGLQLILDRYAPHLESGRDYRPITEAELKRTTVMRIDIDAWSGKQKVAPDDFPGAYDLPGLGDFPWGAEG